MIFPENCRVAPQKSLTILFESRFSINASQGRFLSFTSVGVSYEVPIVSYAM